MFLKYVEKKYVDFHHCADWKHDSYLLIAIKIETGINCGNANNLLEVRTWAQIIKECAE